MEFQASSDLLIGQWRNAKRIAGIIKIFTSAMQTHLHGAMANLARMRRIETAKGVWLDYIGARIGVERPYATATADDPRFGFEGSGRSFDAAPFLGASVNAARFPLPDVVFRRVLTAKGITDIGVGDFDSLERAIHAIDPAAKVKDNLNMTIDVLTDIKWQIELADRLSALPRTAGVTLSYRDRQRFGFEGSGGLPFDQGVFV